MKKLSFVFLFLFVVLGLSADPKKDILGYYTLDGEDFKKRIDEKLGEIPEDARAMAKQQMEFMIKMMSKLVIQFTEKETIGWIPGKGKQAKAYTIEKEEGNKLSVTVEGQTQTLVVEKDSVLMSTPQGEMKFKKITEEEAKKSIAEMEEAVKKAEAEKGTAPTGGEEAEAEAEVQEME